jgi:hypothetical protein
MAIIKYTLDNKAIPGYISDGGYWGDVDDETLIGISESSESGGETISQADLITRVLDIHTRYPFVTSVSNIADETELSNSEVTELVNNWCTAKGVS